MSTPLTSAPVSGPAAPVQQAGRLPQAAQGSAAAKQAKGFEEMLVSQLSQSLVASSGLEGGGEEETGAEGAQGGGAISSLLAQALSENVMHGGGLGLSRQLAGTGAPVQGAPSTAAGGTTAGGAPQTTTTAAAAGTASGGTQA